MAILCTVNGHYANLLSTDSRLGSVAKLQTPYMDTTGMCVELYYRLQSPAIINKPDISVSTLDEERHIKILVASSGENRTSWDRLFARLPEGINQIVIQGKRSSTSYSGMSIDDVVVQSCAIFGELITEKLHK